MIELSKTAGGSTLLLLVTIKCHTTWQEWAPGGILCNFTQNNKSKSWDSVRDGATLPF